MLNTETPPAEHATLDQYPTAELVNVLVDDQFKAVRAVRARRAAHRRRRHRRAAAHGSGRPPDLRRRRHLGPPRRARQRRAVPHLFLAARARAWPCWPAAAAPCSSPSKAPRTISNRARPTCSPCSPAANDVVLLLAASGATPYVLGALRAARAAGALTIGFANNPDAPVAMRGRNRHHPRHRLGSHFGQHPPEGGHARRRSR